MTDLFTTHSNECSLNTFFFLQLFRSWKFKRKKYSNFSGANGFQYSNILISLAENQSILFLFEMRFSSLIIVKSKNIRKWPLDWKSSVLSGLYTIQFPCFNIFTTFWSKHIVINEPKNILKWQIIYWDWHDIYGLERVQRMQSFHLEFRT